MIQAWRLLHDPRQARRLPPHLTLAYWAPRASVDAIGRQVAHAFELPVTLNLGAVRHFSNPEATRYLEVTATDALAAARDRLFDGRHVPFPPPGTWRWHVTVLRYPNRASPATIAAVDTLALDRDWQIDRVDYLELTAEGWRAIGSWPVPAASG